MIIELLNQLESTAMECGKGRELFKRVKLAKRALLTEFTKRDKAIEQLTAACQLHVDSDGNTEWNRKQRSYRQNEAYDKALEALKAAEELN